MEILLWQIKLNDSTTKPLNHSTILSSVRVGYVTVINDILSDTEILSKKTHSLLKYLKGNM
jgi:hypothetical protein